jgi:hypothetical protein
VAPTHFSRDESVFNPFADDHSEFELADPFTLRPVRRRSASTAGRCSYLQQTAALRTCARLSDAAYDPNRFYDEVLSASSEDATAVVEDLFRGGDELIVDCSKPPMSETPLDSDIIELLKLPMPQLAGPRPPVQAGRFRIQRRRIA